MSARTLARHTNVTDDTANASAGNQHAGAFGPYLIQLVQKNFIGINIAELPMVRLVLF
jgi:hypothetical protein